MHGGPFDELDGVISTTSGYTGGQTVNPTYEEVSAGGTGHAEAVQVVYDPQKSVIRSCWPSIGQIRTPRRGCTVCDHGSQYRPEIFYQDDKQRQSAEASKEEIKRTKTFSAPLVTEITQATAFYPAEEYHQDFYRKNPIRYKFYRFTCGRDARLATLWGDEHERHG